MIVYAQLDFSNFAPAKFVTFDIFLGVLLPLAMAVAAIIFLVMILRGAYTWLTAGADPKNVENAQRTITFAFIGIIMVVISFFIVKLLASVLQVKNLPF